MPSQKEGLAYKNPNKSLIIFIDRPNAAPVIPINGEFIPSGASRNRTSRKMGAALESHDAALYCTPFTTPDAPGEYRIVVKVIDIPGNDTTKTVRVVVE